MAVNPATLSQNAYEVGNPLVVPVHLADPVFAHNWINARCVTNTTATNNNTLRINFIINLAGDTIFLPYGQGQIHSVCLPSVVGGPTCFVTAGMSGCKVFIDTVAGSNDLIVYHANCIGIGGGGMNVEAPALTAALAAQHVAAQAYWTGPPNNLVLAAGTSFGRALYGNPAVAEENRKRAQNRANVNFLGGTTVIGELVGGHWRLYWQTYGSCVYRRPGIAPKGWFGNRDVLPADVQYRVLGHGMFFLG